MTATKAPPTDAPRRTEALAAARHEARLEGLHIDPVLEPHLRRYETGELSADEAIELLKTVPLL